jgi:hypothetical protein
MRLHRYLVSLLLGAALLAPVGAQAKKHPCPDRDGKRGYYDNDSRNCHYWDNGEDHHYQSWEQARHQTHKDFARLRAKQQREYWKWRREHPDDNDREHR